MMTNFEFEFWIWILFLWRLSIFFYLVTIWLLIKAIEGRQSNSYFIESKLQYPAVGGSLVYTAIDIDEGNVFFYLSVV